jgi:hypothetical protein
MLTKTSVSNTSSSALAGSGFDERDVRETHSSRVWREELSKMLEANLRHLDALTGLRSTHPSSASALRHL